MGFKLKEVLNNRESFYIKLKNDAVKWLFPFYHKYRTAYKIFSLFLIILDIAGLCLTMFCYWCAYFYLFILH